MIEKVPGQVVHKGIQKQLQKTKEKSADQVNAQTFGQFLSIKSDSQSHPGYSQRKSPPQIPVRYRPNGRLLPGNYVIITPIINKVKSNGLENAQECSAPKPEKP